MGTWVGEGLRREVFFFRSGSARLYGSVYAADPPTGDRGVVVCNSWGYEANQSDVTVHTMALAVARAGGAAMTFHYPGFGDSEGDLEATTMGTLVEAATDALGEAADRCPGMSWALAGLMFGAPVAALAARRAPVERLLLVQPVQRPSFYLSRLERSAERAAKRVPARVNNAYGYPLPRRMLDVAEAIDADMRAALMDFDGTGVVVRFEKPPLEAEALERFEQVTVPGGWRFGNRQSPLLAQSAADWLQNIGAGSAR